MEKDEETMIGLTVATRERIKKFYEHGDDTYSTVLNRLMDCYEKHERR